LFASGSSVGPLVPRGFQSQRGEVLSLGTPHGLSAGAGSIVETSQMKGPVDGIQQHFVFGGPAILPSGALSDLPADDDFGVDRSGRLVLVESKGQDIRRPLMAEELAVELGDRRVIDNRHADLASREARIGEDAPHQIPQLRAVNVDAHLAVDGNGSAKRGWIRHG